MTAPKSVTIELSKVNVGTNADGRNRSHFSFPEGTNQFHAVDNPDPEGMTALYVGPYFNGVAYAADGTAYDCANDVIAVPAKHVSEVDAHIGAHYEANGHPLHTDGTPFVHTPAGPQSTGTDDGAGNATMANASSTAENAALNGLDATSATNVIPDVSLHTASPGTTGASENANAGSYARQACTWNAASSGSKTNSTALTFTTAGSTAVTAFGTWSSATYGAGTYALGGNLTSSVTAVTITFATGSITISIT
jgi:hypothetical protein